MRVKEPPYDSGERGTSVGSRKRVGLSGETATLPFSPLFCYLSRLLLLVLSLENRTTDTTH